MRGPCGSFALFRERECRADGFEAGSAYGCVDAVVLEAPETSEGLGFGRVGRVVVVILTLEVVDDDAKERILSLLDAMRTSINRRRTVYPCRNITSQRRKKACTGKRVDRTHINLQTVKN